MSFWTSLRDDVIKPVAGAVLAPVTGGASLAVVAADRAAPAGSLNIGKGKASASPAPLINPMSNQPAGNYTQSIYANDGGLLGGITPGKNNTLLLIGGGLLLVLLVFRLGR